MPTIGSLVLSLAWAGYSLRSGNSRDFVSGCFSLTITVACVLFLLIGLAKAVTWYRLDGTTLAYGKLGRRRRDVSLSEVVSAYEVESRPVDLLISLHGGYTLRFCPAYLDHVDQGRDLALGGMWRQPQNKKGEPYWVHFGMVAPDDIDGAEQALRWLIQSREEMKVT